MLCLHRFINRVQTYRNDAVTQSLTSGVKEQQREEGRAPQHSQTLTI